MLVAPRRARPECLPVEVINPLHRADAFSTNPTKSLSSSYLIAKLLSHLLNESSFTMMAIFL